MKSLICTAVKEYKQNGPKSLLIKVIFYFALLVFDLLKQYLPWFKKDGLILFGEFGGKSYEGNSKYMYEWIVEQHPQENAVWMTKNDGIKERLEKENRPVERIGSLRSFWYLLRVDVALVTHSALDVFPVLQYSSSVTWIMLDHGSPVKSTQKDRSFSERKRLYGNFDYWLTKSTFTQNMFYEHFEFDRFETEFAITGYPRNDILIEPTEDIQNLWKSEFGDNSYDTVIFYAPTQRPPEHLEHINTTDIFPFNDFSKEQLFFILEKYNILLLIKLHPEDDRKMREGKYEYGSKHSTGNLVEFIQSLDEHPNVEYIHSQHNLSNPNNILPFTDLLITDYSSIYHDYLLLDRPILFIPYDLEMYEKEVGFKYDYEENLPGESVDSFNGFLNSIEKVASGGDLNPESRRRLADKMYKYQDARARERVFDLITRGIS